MEGLGIEIAGAFVEEIADQIGDAGLVLGILVEPPAKEYSMAISGTVASCTNQASMPPGETRCWIFAAACDGETVAQRECRAGGDARMRRVEGRDRSRTLLLALGGAVSLIR